MFSQDFSFALKIFAVLIVVVAAVLKLLFLSFCLCVSFVLFDDVDDDGAMSLCHHLLYDDLILS